MLTKAYLPVGLADVLDCAHQENVSHVVTIPDAEESSCRTLHNSVGQLTIEGSLENRRFIS